MPTYRVSLRVERLQTMTVEATDGEHACDKAERKVMDIEDTLYAEATDVSEIDGEADT